MDNAKILQKIDQFYIIKSDLHNKQIKVKYHSVEHHILEHSKLRVIKKKFNRSGLAYELPYFLRISKRTEMSS